MTQPVNLKFNYGKLRPLRSLFALAFDWIVIFLCISVAMIWPSVIIYFVTAVIIAGRQHALLVLLHDGVHGLLHPNRLWNDRIARGLIGYLFLFNPSTYSSLHIQHHIHMNTENDPNWVWKEASGEWVFPMKISKFIRFCLVSINPWVEIKQTLINVYHTVTDLPQSWRKNQFSVLLHFFYFSLVLSLLLFSGRAVEIALLWFVPMFTFLPFIHRLRSVAEHYGVKSTGPLHGSRNYTSGPIERFLLAPHNVGFHLDHHLQPDVPFYYLPDLHKHLSAQSDYSSHAHQNTGYLRMRKGSVLFDVIEQPGSN